MIKIITIVVLILYATSLQFNNQQFTILQLTDLHYRTTDPNVNQNNQKIVTNLINAVKPDLVVITGDAVSNAPSSHYNTDEFFQNNWKDFIQPFNQTNTKYAYVLGNHDDETNLSGPQIMQLDDHCLQSQRKFASSIFNSTSFQLDIQSSLKNNFSSYQLWFFDTHSHGCNNDKYSYGCVNYDQTEWYVNLSQQIKQQQGVSSLNGLAFMHIPPPEFMDLYNYYPVYGSKYEKVSCSSYNLGIIDSFLDGNDVQGLFVGHDHVNNFGGIYKNSIELVYGTKTGYGFYGPQQGVQRGGRVIKLEESLVNNEVKVNYKHHIIWEDLTISENDSPTMRNDFEQFNCNEDTVSPMEDKGIDYVQKSKKILDLTKKIFLIGVTVSAAMYVIGKLMIKYA